MSHLEWNIIILSNINDERTLYLFWRLFAIHVIIRICWYYFTFILVCSLEQIKLVILPRKTNKKQKKLNFLLVYKKATQIGSTLK